MLTFSVREGFTNNKALSRWTPTELSQEGSGPSFIAFLCDVIPYKRFLVGETRPKLGSRDRTRSR